jgi:cobalamin biosynthesis protein CobT
MNIEQKQTLQRKASSAMESKNIAELTQGYLRCEALRRLTITQFENLCIRNVNGENFDDMVDQLVIAP